MPLVMDAFFFLVFFLLQGKSKSQSKRTCVCVVFANPSNMSVCVICFLMMFEANEQEDRIHFCL